MSGVLAMPTEIVLPEDREFIGTVYSNYDHRLAPEILALLEGDAIAQHAAWDFCGWIVRAEGGYVEHVMRYQELVGVYVCDDIEDLISHVNSLWGES